jgi:hypothetical protein
MLAMPSTGRSDWSPDSLDINLPNAARVYNYLIDGAANFEQDRVFAERLMQVMPEARIAARLNRAFLRRAVRYCVDEGIRQFIDIGSGIPATGNVHEVAQAFAPDSHVVYVDCEPVAVAYGEWILRDDDRADALQADVVDADVILGSEPVQRLIDFDQPVAILMFSVLHFVPDHAGPYSAVARYVQAMAPGSFLVISHAVAIEDPEQVSRIDRLYEHSADQGVRRDLDQIAEFFAGTELVEPGLVWTSQWRPESLTGVGEHPETSLLVAGAGRKP